jgi:hypothetical protein
LYGLCMAHTMERGNRKTMAHLYNHKKDNVTGDLNSPTADNDGCANLIKLNKGTVTSFIPTFFMRDIFYRTIFIKTLFLCN